MTKLSFIDSAPTKKWESLSFASTLYLHPVLDALLAPTPALLHDEVRLGLQEALVNAAKHGNHLDPQKVISVRYAKMDGYYWWIVTDQGNGFEQPATCTCPTADHPFVSECGRGLYILHQVFDQVRWSDDGKEVHLAKQVKPTAPTNLMSPTFFIRLIESWWRRWSAPSAHGV
ncbi:MAG: anti-sigma regulatory factor [Cyanobacteria bacterium J06623_5]